MGRRSPEPPPGFLDLNGAAKELNVSSFTVRSMVKRGVLVTHFFEQRRRPFFRVADLQEVQLALRDSTDLQEVKALALQALSAARRTEARQAEMHAKLGIDCVVLQRDASSLRMLYDEAQRDIEPGQLCDPNYVRYWGGCFFSMEEVYLELVGKAVGVEEPWRVYLDFARRLAEGLHTQRESGLRLAIEYFTAARRHLTNVAYLHCRRMGSARVGDVVFDGRATAVDELSAILF